MRLTILLFVAVTTPTTAETLLSGLEDPLVSEATCLAFSSGVTQGVRDPILDEIAFSEGIVAHSFFHEDARLASRTLGARTDGSEKVDDAIAGFLVERACRLIDR